MVTANAALTGGEAVPVESTVIRVYVEAEMELICKCCGKPARRCSEGEKACGVEGCAHIHCDHCGMHYSLESEAALGVETHEEDWALMLAAYNAELTGEGKRSLPESSDRRERR